MICKDRDVFFDQKGWGFEQWMANSELYCGKLLVVFAEKKCSIHFHKLKDETFYIQSGLIKMRVWEEPFEVEKGDPFTDPSTLKLNQFSEFLMGPGDRLVIPQNVPHQFEGVSAETTIIEISTQHFEEDSYRILQGD